MEKNGGAFGTRAHKAPHRFSKKRTSCVMVKQKFAKAKRLLLHSAEQK